LALRGADFFFAFLTGFFFLAICVCSRHESITDFAAGRLQAV
jgi:hypothetical protein